MSLGSRRQKAERRFNRTIEELKPLARRTLAAIFVSRFVLSLVPLQLKYLLDPVLNQQPIQAFGLTIGYQTGLAILIVASSFVAVVRGFADFYYVANAGLHGHKLVAKLRIAMYEHIMRIPSEYARRRGTGKILLRFIGDSDALRSWYSRRKPAVSVDYFLVWCLVIVMLVVDWRLALVVMLPIPLMVVICRYLAPIIADKTLNARFNQAAFSGTIGHRFDFIEQAKWLDRYQKNRIPIRKLAYRVAELNASRDRRSAWLTGIGQAIAFLSVPLLIFACVVFAWNRWLQLGATVAFVWLTIHLAVTLHRLNSAVVIREKANVSRERIVRLLERRSEPGRSRSTPAIQPQSATIEFERVRFSDTETTLSLKLSGFGLHRIEDSNLRSVVNGIFQLKRVASGVIQVAGQKLNQVDVSSVRRHLGWVPSQPILFPGTVLDNILVGFPDLERGEVETRCRQLDPSLDTRWLDQQVEFQGRNLTRLGQTKISLIRAMLNRPMIVCFENINSDPQIATFIRSVISRFENQTMFLFPASLATSVFANSEAQPSTSELGTVIHPFIENSHAQ